MSDEKELWRDRNKVFVAGLPRHVDDDSLYEKFQDCGEMFQAKVVYDKNTGNSKGFGFLTFCEYVGALNAVEKMNGTKWEKRTLNVRFLEPKNGAAAPAAPAKAPAKKLHRVQPEGCTTVYVGNLSYDINEEVVRRVFGACGDIQAIRFAEHIQTKEFRGFAYVQFHEESACAAAVGCDGMVVMGRPMVVDYNDSSEEAGEKREDFQKKLKKGICHKFQKGECQRGDACKFAHMVEASEPPVASEPPAVPQGESTDETPVCQSFIKGKCKRGSKCRFRHGTAEVESGNEVVEETPEEVEDGTPICQNFAKGKCKRGDKCKFIHSKKRKAEDVEASSKRPRE